MLFSLHCWMSVQHEAQIGIKTQYLPGYFCHDLHLQTFLNIYLESTLKAGKN